YIGATATLTLPAGMELWFPDDARDLVVDGTLKALGTAADPVRFWGSNPSSSEYGGTIYFTEGSHDNVLQYALIERMGDSSNSADAAVYADSAAVSFVHTTITDTQSRHLLVSARTPHLLEFEDNTIPTCHVGSGPTTVASATWAVPDSSYTMVNILQINYGDTLRLLPGTQIDFPNYANNIYVEGVLLVQGEQSNRVRFFGTNPDVATVLDWGGGLYFHESSAGSIISFAEFEKLGTPYLLNYNYGTIITFSPNLSIQNNQFKNCLKYAVYVAQHSPVIKENCFENMIGISNSPAKYGVFATAGADPVVDATNNYWDSADGPYNALNNPGGNPEVEATDNVLVIPYNEICLEFIEYDLGIVQLAAPESGCALTANEAVQIQVVNAGVSPQSNFEVSYVFDGLEVTELVTATIQPGQIYTHTFAGSVDLSAKD
ncbi:MAG: hypothetical protein KDC44_19005, partial [Phaeodactylibacter sp.]|nr:hypothetical protein [Phaeodactylibacter sp.]